MSIAESTGAATPRSSARPLRKRVMHLIRRGHLYFGLFLFPWAILYGVTAFLFNHPTAFSDQPTVNFGRDSLIGTPLEDLPTPMSMAEQVVMKLNEVQQPTSAYRLAGEAKYAGRDFAFATVKADGQTVSVLLDVKHGVGTLRSAPIIDKKETERAPFTISGANRGAREPRNSPPVAASDPALILPSPVHERMKAALPSILERNGFPSGEITVTSVPDIRFPIEADGRTWTANYNPMNGSISGVPADAPKETELSFRRFLLRLHTAHGYPGEMNGKWFWALIVDAMAFIMCFWGLSGLLMWWQIKATRKLGAMILIVSAIAATTLGVAMHTLMTG